MYVSMFADGPIVTVSEWFQPVETELESCTEWTDTFFFIWFLAG